MTDYKINDAVKMMIAFAKKTGDILRSAFNDDKMIEDDMGNGRCLADGEVLDLYIDKDERHSVVETEGLDEAVKNLLCICQKLMTGAYK